MAKSICKCNMAYQYIVRTPTAKQEQGGTTFSFAKGVRGIDCEAGVSGWRLKTPSGRTGEDLSSKVISNNGIPNVRLYKGKHFVNRLSNHLKYIPNSNLTKIYDAKWRPVIPKVVVFDLDETIGSFADLYLIWTAIFNTGIYTGPTCKTIVQSIFNELLDLYPEFLRYGILHILDFIRTKIQNGESHRIYLYTNNHCNFVASPDSRDTTQPSPTEWIEMIIIYLNMKIGVTDTIFAKPICAFKIGSRIIEPLRTTRNKTHSDFLKCAVLPKNTEICFIDDTHHSQMVHNKVYYIQPPPYVHELTQLAIIDRFMVSSLYTKLNTSQYNTKQFESIFTINCQLLLPNTLLSKNDNNNNKEVYNKMMYYIKEFFCISTKTHPTRRKRVRIGKFTRKRKLPIRV